MIEIIAGSNRPNANSLQIARALHKVYAELGKPAQILSLSDLPPAIFNPSSYEAKPKEFEPFSERILKARGLHLVVPEYNGSFPGVLKYFIDMLKFPESFDHRPTAFIGVSAGAWGGLRSVEQLQMVFGYRNACILPERVFIPGINQAWVDRDNLALEESLQSRLAAQVKAFIHFVKLNRPA